MDLRNLKKLTVGGIELKQLLISGIQVWKSGYKNWVKFSTEADGKTIYNGGLGYKHGYRIRSGGAEAAASVASCTGFIPVNGGDVVRLSGAYFDDVSNANAINVSDANFANIGQLVSNYPNGGYGIFADEAYQEYRWNSVVKEIAGEDAISGVWKWIVPPAASGVAYIRVTGVTGDFASLIVTVNEEITQ